MAVTGFRRQVRRSVLLLAVALVALASIGVASAQIGTPKPITDEARKIEDLWIFTLAIAAVVFVAVEGALVYALIRFRKRNDELPAQTHGSTVLEFVWTGIPVLIVIALFTYSFIVLRDVENTAAAEDMTIEVQGFQYQWQFTYQLNDLGVNADPSAPGEISIIGTAAEEPTLVIPIDEPIEFRLLSNDVIHSFYIRDFLYKLDVVPGRDNRFVITARETGEYFGQCAELCGLNHALMRFKLKVVTRDEFDLWVAEQTGGTGDSAVRRAD